jgi:hypothetical protein
MNASDPQLILGLIIGMALSASILLISLWHTRAELKRLRAEYDALRDTGELVPCRCAVCNHHTMRPKARFDAKDRVLAYCDVCGANRIFLRNTL